MERQLGGWCIVDPTSTTVEESLGVALEGGDDWRQRFVESGMLERAAEDFRRVVNDSLPDSVVLCGNEFFLFGSMDREGAYEIVQKIVSEILDTYPLIERWDPDTNQQMILADVARYIGIRPSTLRSYIARRKPKNNPFPQPDGQFSKRNRWWYRSTIDRWQNERKGTKK